MQKILTFKRREGEDVFNSETAKMIDGWIVRNISTCAAVVPNGAQTETYIYYTLLLDKA